jgi:hypothetical protein
MNDCMTWSITQPWRGKGGEAHHLLLPFLSDRPDQGNFIVLMVKKNSGGTSSSTLQTEFNKTICNFRMTYEWIITWLLIALYSSNFYVHCWWFRRVGKTRLKNS